MNIIKDLGPLKDESGKVVYDTVSFIGTKEELNKTLCSYFKPYPHEKYLERSLRKGDVILLDDMIMTYEFQLKTLDPGIHKLFHLRVMEAYDPPIAPNLYIERFKVEII